MRAANVAASLWSLVGGLQSAPQQFADGSGAGRKPVRELEVVDPA